MNTRLYGWIFSAAAVLAVVCLAPTSGQGQDQAKGKGGGAAKGGGGGGAKGGGYQPPAGPAPRTPDGKIDFSGYWQRPYTPDMSASATDMAGKPFPNEARTVTDKDGNIVTNGRGVVAPPPAADAPAGRGGRGGGGSRVLPYTAWGLNDWKNYSPDNGDYTGACLPFGLMRSINSPDPLQVMQDKTYMTYLFEQNTWFHLFPIDGRAHRDQVPTWFGDSVGKWDGDTLVIETVNFNGKTRLDTNGHPHSDQLVLTEKWNRTDFGHVTYDMIIHDPKTYTQDWKTTRQFILRTDQEIMEYSCEENNKALYEGRIKPPKYN